MHSHLQFLNHLCTHLLITYEQTILPTVIVKLRQGSGKDQQGMAVKVKGLKAQTLA